MKLLVNNGCFSYHKSDKQLLLDHINFETNDGDLLAILGPNGAGKTTMLRCIMGFLKWSNGESLLDGKNICTISHRELWKTIAYIPQAKNTTFAYTVEEMVLIARALAAEPKILVLDEPESNLDFKNQLLILETMSELANQGITCIFNTHYPAHALQRANKAMLLCKDGRFLFGDTRSVITEKNIETAFGVKAVIGEIETQSHILQDVLPLSVSTDEYLGEIMEKGKKSSERKIATIAILAKNQQIADRINSLLSDYSHYIIGRMGMPYPDGNIYIINVTMDAPYHIVESLSSKLGMLRDVSIKAIYAM
jgi:iron complex transport system ATP-binding protein